MTVQLLFAQFFSQSWMERLGWTLLHFLWQGALIAAAFAMVRGRARSPQTRYLLGCAVLAAMVAAPVATFAYLGSPGVAASPATRGVLVEPSGVQSFGPWQADAWSRALPWLVVLWLAGVLAFSIRLTGGWWMTARLRSSGYRPAAGEWQQTIERLAGRIGVARPVKFLISSRVEAPIVIGWLRPVILMPIGALTGLPLEHVEALVAHELAHIRRHDYAVNVLQSIAEAVLFYHPAVWWVSAQIRAEREHCCDDEAVAACGDTLTYARALTNLESCRTAHAAYANTALGANGGGLRGRIGRLLDPAGRPSDMLPGPGAGWALAALIVVGICALAALPAALPAAPAQAPVVDRASIWEDTVKFGDMQRKVRGLGTLATATAAEIQIAEPQVKEIRLGQAAAIAFRDRKEAIPCKVTRIRPGVSNGTITIDVQLEGALPSGIQAPEMVDAAIVIEQLSNIVYVGRPVKGEPDSEATLFKVDPDGASAVRTNVRFGRVSINTIEVRSGLQPGDRIILSDMSAYQGVDRVTLR